MFVSKRGKWVPNQSSIYVTVNLRSASPYSTSFVSTTGGVWPNRESRGTHRWDDEGRRPYTLRRIPKRPVPYENRTPIPYDLHDTVIPENPHPKSVVDYLNLPFIGNWPHRDSVSGVTGGSRTHSYLEVNGFRHWTEQKTKWREEGVSTKGPSGGFLW